MLEEVSRKKAVWIVTSYLGEGLPWSVMHQMVTEYLTSIHASLDDAEVDRFAAAVRQARRIPEA